MENTERVYAEREELELSIFSPLLPSKGIGCSNETHFKYKAALSAAYAAGLRVSEVLALKVLDIDSERLLLRIEQGKGRKDRFAMLSPRLLDLLRDWYRIARPAVWLFPGRDPMLPMTTRQFAQRAHAQQTRA